MSTARILVVEDEAHIAAGLKENLELEGYHAEVVDTGPAGLTALSRAPWDLCLLDVMLPGLDGFEICQRARAAGVRTPILFLTARGAVDDRVRGLAAGGDDYLPKPFHLDELLTRIQAILRRQAWAASAAPRAVVALGESRIDLTRWTATGWDGAAHTLTEKEVLLLQALLARPGQVLTREEVAERVWGYEVFPSTRVLESLMARLRRRFEPDPDHPRHLHTERGVGFRITLE